MRFRQLLFGFLFSGQLLSITNQFDSVNDSINLTKSKFRFEFFVFPAFVFNNLSFGISIRKKDNFEQVFKINTSYVFLLSESLNYNLSSNSNFYFKNSKNYLPFWFKVSNTRNDVGFEEGYFPHSLRFILGTGFGRVFTIGKKLNFRTEFGFGGALNLTNSKGDVFPVLFNYSEYKFDEQYPKYNPKFLPSFRLNLAFLINR